MQEDAIFLYCPNCTTIFNVRYFFHNSFDYEKKQISCPVCGHHPLANAEQFIETILGTFVEVLNRIDDIWRKLEKSSYDLDKLFNKIHSARKNGILVNFDLDMKVVHLLSRIDELGVRLAQLILDFDKAIVKDFRRIRAQLTDELKAKLNEYAIFNPLMIIKRNLDEIVTEIDEIQRIVAGIRGSASYVYSLISLKKELGLKENISEAIIEGNFAIILTTQKLYEVYLPQKKIVTDVELASIRDVQKGRFSRNAVLKLIKGKKKLHTEYSDELRKRILRFVILEDYRKNVDDIQLLKEVAFPVFTDVIYAIVKLKEDLLVHLVKLHRIVIRKSKKLTLAPPIKLNSFKKLI